MKIAVIGRTAYTKLLRKYLKSGFIIKQFSNINSQNLSKFKDFDVLISMTWGKSLWGKIKDLRFRNKKIKINSFARFRN